jgi:hypothetical protein
MSEEERKRSSKWVIIEVGLILTFICIFHLGIVGYISGLILSQILFVIHIYGSLLSYLLIVYLIVRLCYMVISFKRNKMTLKKRFLISIIAIIVLIIPTIMRNFSDLPTIGYVPAHGFCHRMRCKADIPAIRKWLKEQKDDKGGSLNNAELQQSDLPMCIKELQPSRVSFCEGDRLYVELVWRFAFNMGLVVGPETMENTEQYYYTLSVKPGVYVWAREK